MDERAVTQLLQQWSAGDLEAAERVLPLVYGELRRIAARQIRRERGGALAGKARESPRDRPRHGAGLGGAGRAGAGGAAGPAGG
jgi:hypothetical protein